MKLAQMYRVQSLGLNDFNSYITAYVAWSLRAAAAICTRCSVLCRALTRCKEYFMTLSAGTVEEALGKLPLYHGIRSASAALERPYEIVFVEDGSHDRTFEVLKEIQGQDSRAKVVRFRNKYGQTATMATGFDQAWFVLQTQGRQRTSRTLRFANENW